MAIATRPSTIQNSQVRRVELNVSEFIRTLDQHGYYARWTKATLCPNRDPDQEDHHLINCKLCDTAGFIYFDPKDIRVLMTSYSTKQLFMSESRYEPGTVYITALPAHKLSFWDRVELSEARTRFTQVMKVSQQSTYKLKYPVLSVENVVTNKGTTISSVTVGDDGRITLSVPTGTAFFAVSYFYHPTYVVIDLLHAVRDSRATVRGADEEVDFPTQAVGRLDFLIRDESLP